MDEVRVQDTYRSPESFDTFRIIANSAIGTVKRISVRDIGIRLGTDNHYSFGIFIHKSVLTENESLFLFRQG